MRGGGGGGWTKKGQYNEDTLYYDSLDNSVKEL